MEPQVQRALEMATQVAYEGLVKERGVPFAVAWRRGIELIARADIAFVGTVTTSQRMIAKANAEQLIAEWYQDGEIECRGDEDCDHCNLLSFIHTMAEESKELESLVNAAKKPFKCIRCDSRTSIPIGRTCPKSESESENCAWLVDLNEELQPFAKLADPYTVEIYLADAKGVPNGI